MDEYYDEFLGIHNGPLRFHDEKFTMNEIDGFGSCMEEVERVCLFILVLPTLFFSMATLKSDQLKQLKDIFMRFDMDSDGSLTQLELAALLRSLGLKPTGDQIHVMLANMDSNGNGSVEFDELVNAIMPDMSEQILINQEQLMEVFRSFDRDGNGVITAAELAGSMAKMGQPLTFGELAEMIREADEDGDGVISFNEFASIMAKSAADFLGITVS
ncbi:EF-hand domain [Dillenia turbinata]|uniref:EF-hand domain n=1 Tax=Dillenia turbinata TaxID=194707 RepID=A0AAN8Z0E9_9MAGN